jgi:DNA-binding LacI/PurR family transcriptional regulator
MDKLPNKPLTLKDVALRAGVSHSTVSRAINHPELINGATLERIMKLVQELGYHTNPFARSLQTSHSSTIALVVPSISNLAFANLTAGVQAALEEATTRYDLLIFSSDENLKKERFICNLLLQHRVDGVIFVSSAGGPPPTSLLPENMAKVLVERSNKKVDSLILDLEGGLIEACSHLHELGHKKIAIITGDTTSITSKERLKWFQGALAVFGLPLATEYVEHGGWTARGGWEAMLRLLQLPEPPTAVFGVTDTIAMGAMGAASSLGFNIPADCSVIGFNNEPGSSELNPPLTTLDACSFQIGKHAAEILLGKIRNPDRQPTEVKYSLRLLKRSSTAPPRS